MFGQNYFKADYFSSYFKVQLDIQFDGGQVSYATLRFFDFFSNRILENVALNPAIVNDVVTDIIFTNQTVNIDLVSDVQVKTFLNAVTPMILQNESSDVTNEDIATLKTFISTSIRRN